MQVTVGKYDAALQEGVRWPPRQPLYPAAPDGTQHTIGQASYSLPKLGHQPI